MGPGLKDILQTCKNPTLIFYMAWSDVRARYKRSILGPVWITISTAIGVLGLGFIGSALFKIDRSSYLPPLTVGLVLWQFMSGSITESASIFARQSNIIRNLTLPISLHSAQLILRQMINLAHTLPLFFLVALIVGQPLTAMTWLAIPNFIIVALNLAWMSLMISILGARFRDLEYIIAAVLPLLMFFSPVMYRPNALPYGGLYIWLNPLADMIEIIRYPLLGEPTPLFLYGTNLAMLLAGSLATIILFNAKRNRIAFWV